MASGACDRKQRRIDVDRQIIVAVALQQSFGSNISGLADWAALDHKTEEEQTPPPSEREREIVVGRTRRIVLFFGTLLLLILLFVAMRGRDFLDDDVSIVLFSSLLMLSFVALFLEHFFTTPTDVLTSSLAILLMISPLHQELSRFGVWYKLFFGYNVLLFLAALIALLMLDRNRPNDSLQNRLSASLKKFAVTFGDGRFLFTALFLLTLLFYVDSQEPEFMALAGFAAFIIFADPTGYAAKIFESEKPKGNDIGELIGVQSRNTFLAKLYDQHVPVRRFDLVEFDYSMQEDDGVIKGMIIDNYLLNEQQWVKILSTPEMRRELGAVATNEIDTGNVVHRVGKDERDEYFRDFVGVVVEDSKINRIRFEYAGRVPVSEGDLLEVRKGDRVILYQVVQGLTATESLEAKNEAGFIVGEAVQLGDWSPERQTFEQYGWVPDINTPVFRASEIDVPELAEADHTVGSLPDTNYPVVVDLEDVVTHHLAVLGVTGCGKSVLTRHLVRRLIDRGTKVICVDFTDEYGEKFEDDQYRDVVPGDREETLFAAIETLDRELAKFKNNQDPDVIERAEEALSEGFTQSLSEFLQGDDDLALFELPNVSNTTAILEYTRWFFQSLFKIARQEDNYGQQLCVVLEEAHTVIPEWNFIGVGDKKAQSLVNKIGQIALQGRKYGVGFIVVAQRTANVSKTVLTQCNSIIAFQQFDQTAADFLANYMGEEMVEAVPNLKPRHAIAVGKAFRSGIPTIFEVPDLPDA